MKKLYSKFCSANTAVAIAVGVFSAIIIAFILSAIINLGLYYFI